MPEAMVKGAVIREFVTWFELHQGRERIRTIAERAPEDLRDLLDPDEPLVRILPSSWYPARLVHSILDTLSEDIPEARLVEMAHDATRWAISRAMNGVYRFTFEKLASPQVYAALVPRLWRQLHTTGERRLQVTGPGQAESVVSSWAGHHPLLCTITVEMMCGLFEKMGCKDVRYKRTSCVSRGAKECVTRVTWR
jgi:hypothetical protein